MYIYIYIYTYIYIYIYIYPQVLRDVHVGQDDLRAPGAHRGHEAQVEGLTCCRSLVLLLFMSYKYVYIYIYRERESERFESQALD